MTYKRPFPLRRAGHWLAHRIVLASAVCLLAGSLAGSAGGQAPADQPPPETEGVGVTEHLDARLPLDLTFLDEEGRTVRLGDYFEGRKPVILNLVYFSCPMLCTLVLNGVVENMTALKWDLGKQYENVTVSFDPRETPELAKAKKQTYLASYGRPGGDAGWHFLTGTQQNINVLTGAVGFGYRWDPAGNQFVHPAVTVVCTPDGRIARYLYGVQYEQQTFKLALLDAADGRFGTTVDKVILYCFHYDPKAGRYTPMAVNIMRIGGGIVVAVLGALLGSLWLMERRRRRLQTAARRA